MLDNVWYYFCFPLFFLPSLFTTVVVIAIIIIIIFTIYVIFNFANFSIFIIDSIVTKFIEFAFASAVAQISVLKTKFDIDRNPEADLRQSHVIKFNTNSGAGRFFISCFFTISSMIFHPRPAKSHTRIS